MRLLRSCLSVIVLLATHAQGQVAPTYYWKLDETAGTMARDVMGHSDGLVSGNTEWQPSGGHHAGALRFNGTTARVDLGPCDITTGDGQGFSIACWFKPEIVPGTERILMAKADGAADMLWSLSLVNNTGARFRLRTGGVTHTVDIPPSSLFSGTWYHLAGTYDGHQLLFYLNGSLTAYAPAGGSIDTDPAMPATLANLADNSLPFYGSLDDVRIYGTTLSAMDVIELVIGDVATSTHTPILTVGADGTLRSPPGTWTGMEVFDQTGRLVLNERLSPMGARMPTLPSGIYLIRLSGAAGIWAARLLFS